MKFVDDEGVDAPIVRVLRNQNHDVFYIAESLKSISDERILKIANQKKSVLITADKDFGELVFRRKQVHHGVLLLRLKGLKPKRKAEILSEVVEEIGDRIVKAFVVVHPGHYKIRSDGSGK